MNLKSIIVIVVGVVIIVGGYFAVTYFLPQQAQSGGSLERGATLAPNDTTVIARDNFVRLLTSIQSLKLDSTLFADPAFVSLVDFSVELHPQVAGRKNPFLPIDAEFASVAPAPRGASDRR